MKKIVLLFSLVIIAMLAANVAATPVVSPGYDPTAVLKGGVRYRNFDSSGQREIFLGKPDLGVGGNRVERDCVWVSPGTNHVKFSYDSTLGQLDTVVTCGVNVYTLTYPSGNLGTLNYMQITVASRVTGATVGFHNVLLDSNSLGNFDPPGLVWSDWMVTNYDFSNGFVIEGDLVLTGTQTGGETNKVEIKVGYIAQYYLTVKTDPAGIVTIPGEGMYLHGATPTLTAPAGPVNRPFLFWDVDGVRQGNYLVTSITVTMDADHTATAHYGSSVGGEWAPINTVQLVTPWIAYALLAIASAAALSHCLLKKRL